MVFDGRTIAFIGSGNMAEAMLKGLIGHAVVTPQQIIAADPLAERGAYLQSTYGVHWTDNNTEATAQADILILSIKPQVVPQVLPMLRDAAQSCELILSIMAGVQLQKIVAALGNGRVVRAMPNTPAQVGEGISAWTAPEDLPDTQRQQAEALLRSFGEALFMPQEHALDMVTAISGSGPAYVFLFIEAMTDAGVQLGLSRADAETLVLHTLRGSATYAQVTGTHPALLRNQVTSPGGTTAAALYELEKGGLRATVTDAVLAAFQRAIALGQG